MHDWVQSLECSRIQQAWINKDLWKPSAHGKNQA